MSQVSQDPRAQQLLARLALLQLAPPEQQEQDLPVLREAWARLVASAPRASAARQDLMELWARRVLPVLKALRAARVPSEQRVLLVAQERSALSGLADRLGSKA